MLEQYPLNRPARIGLVSISDRASQGLYQDLGLPGLRAWLESAITSDWEPIERLIPDEQEEISKTLVNLIDDTKCDLVFTTGGTGPTVRDVTPEATLAIADKELPGFGEQMRQISLHYVLPPGRRNPQASHGDQPTRPTKIDRRDTRRRA